MPDWGHGHSSYDTGYSYGSTTPFFNNHNIQAWHCNAFKAINKATDGTYDQNWIIGVYTPYFNNTNVQPWHYNAFNATHSGYCVIYDHSWTFGDNTPHLLSDHGKFALINTQGTPNISSGSHTSNARIGAILRIFCIIYQTLQ